MGRIQDTIIINESGLYSLIFNNKLDSAKKFKHWVTSDIFNLSNTFGITSLRGKKFFQIPALLERVPFTDSQYIELSFLQVGDILPSLYMYNN